MTVHVENKTEQSVLMTDKPTSDDVFIDADEHNGNFNDGNNGGIKKNNRDNDERFYRVRESKRGGAEFK